MIAVPPAVARKIGMPTSHVRPSITAQWQMGRFLRHKYYVLAALMHRKESMFLDVAK